MACRSLSMLDPLHHDQGSCHVLVMETLDAQTAGDLNVWKELLLSDSRTGGRSNQEEHRVLATVEFYRDDVGRSI